MSDVVPYTEKKLKDWAGWRAFRDGKALFERGVVEKVTYEHPFVTGVLNLGPRGMRSKFEILKNGLSSTLARSSSASGGWLRSSPSTSVWRSVTPSSPSSSVDSTASAARNSMLIKRFCR